MENNLSYTFAIIGGGLTATSMLCQLVDKLLALRKAGRKCSQDLSLVVFEKNEEFGPGLPHSDRNVLPFHITNMCAKDMTVRSGKPGDFQNWVQRNLRVLETVFPELASAAAWSDCQWQQCHHYPRAIMGEYLKSQFKDGVETARNLGLSVVLCPNCEVTDLHLQDESIYLSVNETSDSASRVYRADGVLLATGHWFESSDTENYFSSPWPAVKLLSSIPQGETVGVIGSSLSAIEVALTLSSDGHFARQSSGELYFVPADIPRRLILYSRNGLLPRVRGQSGLRKNRYLTCDRIRQLIAGNPRQLTLSVIFQLLDQELTAAYGRATDWQQVIRPAGDAAHRLQMDITDAQRGDGPDGELTWLTILVQIFPVVRDLYLNLTLAERQRFDREFTTLFFMHAATQPIINAEKLLALMRAGIVSIVKLGNHYRFEHNPASAEFEFIYDDSVGNSHRDAYHYVVNARGQSRSLESDRSALTNNLLNQGLIQVEETQAIEPAGLISYKTGSILVNPETLQVIRPGSEANARLNGSIFAVGAMTRGQMIDASMANGIARSTAVIAEGLITGLCSSDGREQPLKYPKTRGLSGRY